MHRLIGNNPAVQFFLCYSDSTYVSVEESVFIVALSRVPILLSGGETARGVMIEHRLPRRSSIADVFRNNGRCIPICTTTGVEKSRGQ